MVAGCCSLPRLSSCRRFRRSFFDATTTRAGHMTHLSIRSSRRWDWPAPQAGAGAAPVLQRIHADAEQRRELGPTQLERVPERRELVEVITRTKNSCVLVYRARCRSIPRLDATLRTQRARSMFGLPITTTSHHASSIDRV